MHAPVAMGGTAAFVGAMILPRVGLGLGRGMIGSIIDATLGAVILLFVIRLVKRA